MSEFDDYFDPDEVAFRQQQSDEMKAAERQAEKEPGFDYFEKYPPEMSKIEIGRYVASQGFNVPVIGSSAEWEDVFDRNLAMIRSELNQDYKGWSGLLSSLVIRPERIARMSDYGGSSLEFRKKMNELVLAGLRSGELDPAEYMRLFEWSSRVRNVSEDANRLGVNLRIGYAMASLWRHVPGTNLTVFRDPNVDGRYHLRTKPQKSWVMGWALDKQDHTAKLAYEDSGRDIVVQEVIDFYEAIRSLPRFDNTQTPLLEMQMDEEGQLHFLQYLKTGHELEPTDPFDLPDANNVLRATNVRGTTSEEGEEIRLYITPRKLTPNMRGQGFFFSLIEPHGFAVQAMSAVGSVVVHEAYVSLKDNHFDSAPLYRPKVGMGLIRCAAGVEYARKLREMVDLAQGHGAFRDKTPNYNVYIDAKVTANGQEATIESDWEPKFEDM